MNLGPKGNIELFQLSIVSPQYSDSLKGKMDSQETMTQSFSKVDKLKPKEFLCVWIFHIRL